ncbi:hypothetical protein PF049_00205 [Erythrobacteraceae bacterium WH01K]|nr:hypothetical protein PF049_00205 [Erythrobacteraceae bacterium WH01K]
MSDVTKIIKVKIDASGARRGAREVDDALSGVGKSAKGMQREGVKASDAIDSMTGKMKGASSQGRKLGGVFDRIKSEVKGATPAISGFSSKLMGIGAAVGVIGGVGAAFAKMAGDMSSEAREMANSARISGESFEEFQRQAAGAKTVGIDFEKLGDIFKDTRDKIGDFSATGAGPMKDFFEQIAPKVGLTKDAFKNLSGKDGLQLYYDSLKKAGVSQDEMVFYMEAIASDATNLIPLLENGGKAFEEFGSKAAIISDEDAAGLKKYAEAQVRMEAATRKLSIAFVSSGLLDHLTTFVEKAAGIVDSISNANPTLVKFGAGFAALAVSAGAIGLVVPTIATGFNLMGGALKLALPLLTGVGKALVFMAANPVILALAGVIAGIYLAWENWDKIKPIIDGVGNAISDWWNGNVEPILTSVMDKVRSVADFFKDYFGAQISGGINVISSLLKGDFSGAWEAAKTTVLNMMKAVTNLASNFAPNITQYMRSMYVGVKTWLQDKLGSVFNWVSDKIKAVERSFYWLADQVVLNSHIPDMVDLIGMHMKRLDENMVRPAQAASSAVEGAFAKLPKAIELPKIGKGTMSKEAQSFLEGAANDVNRTALDLAVDEELTRLRLLGLTEDQLEVERAILDYRNDALSEGVNINGELSKQVEEQIRQNERQRIALAGINDERDEALRKEEQLRVERERAASDLVRRGSQIGGQLSSTFRDRDLAAQIARDKQAAAAAYASGAYGTGEIADKIYREVLDGLNGVSGDAAKQMQADFGHSISELGDLIGGSWGRAISGIGNILNRMVAAADGDLGAAGPIGQISGIIGGLIGDREGLSAAFAESSDDFLNKVFKGETFTKPIQEMTDSFADFKGDIGKIFGKNGELTKELGNILGRAGAGAQIGSAVAGVGNMIWDKFSDTGSQIGGALGSVFGPLGSLAGSVLGGTIGGLFKKTKQGYAVVSNNRITTGGNSDARIDSAVQSGNSIQNTLGRIADQLGGSVGSFGNIVIGTRKDNWKVQLNGTSLKNKHGAKDFGEDGQAEAIRYALGVAIDRGAITGIRASTNALLKKGDDIEAQLEKALRFEGVFRNLENLRDPLQATITAFTDEFESLIGLFKEAGATTSEWAELEEYRSLKMQALIKQETATFRDILKELNGEAGGTSLASMLKRDLNEFATFKADIAAGKSVDQGDYSDLVGSILDNASIYGMNSIEYQDIIGQLRGATQGAIGNVERSFANDPTAKAIAAQTNALLPGQNLTNDLLARLLAEAQSTASKRGVAPSKSSFYGYNGKLLKAF